MLARSFSTDVPELNSNQEEADTHLLMHTKHAYDSGIQNVLLVTEDKDIIALLLANADLLNGQLFPKNGTQNCQRFLDIKQLRSGFLAGLRLINGLRLFKNVNDFKTDFR